jgi:hypothetical protein
MRHVDAKPFRPALLYPLLFAAHPALALAAANPGQFVLSDLLVTVAASVLAIAVLYAIIALVLGPARRDVAALIALLAVFALFYVMPLSRIPAGLGIAVPRPFVTTAALSLLFAALLLAWVFLRRPALQGATRTLMVASVVLVVWASFSVWRNSVNARRQIESSDLVRSLAAPVRVRADSGIDGVARRDIYVIVLDEFANSEILRERFRFDNGAFLDSLRQLGFVAPGGLRSNYSQTLLSLPSLLNFAHMTALQSELGGGTQRSYDVPRHLIEQNRTARFLRERGYRFVFFPSSWWRLTLHNPHADEEFDALPELSLRRELFDSEFRRTLVESSLLGKLDLDNSNDLREHVLRTFAALERVSARPEPTFTLAHLMSPHWPYVLNSRCEPSSADAQALPPELEGPNRAYIEQVVCVQRLTLRLVRQILASSSPAPIIVLQSDHGSKSLDQMELDTLPGAPALRERFGAFGAYYLPDGGAEALGDPHTIVNVLGRVLSYYFGAEVETHADALYFSSNERPFRLLPVDSATLVRAD